MPVPQRQTPKGIAAANGSVLSEAVPVSSIPTDLIKIVIYGINRVGKTWLACQFPKPLLLLDFEPARNGGARTVRKVEGVTYLHFKPRTRDKAGKHTESGIDKALRLAVEMKAMPTFPFKTVVIDSATSAQDIILTEILDLPEVPEMLSWGMATWDNYRARSSKTREFLRPFLGLPCHTVVTAKEANHRPKDDDVPDTLGIKLENFFGADLGEKTAGWLHDACDYLGRLYIDHQTVERKVKVQGKEKTVIEATGKQVRRLRTLLHPNYAAGFRSENPTMVPEFIEEPTYEKILKVIKGERL